MAKDGDEWEVLSFLVSQSNLGMKKGLGIGAWETKRRAGCEGSDSTVPQA